MRRQAQQAAARRRALQRRRLGGRAEETRPTRASSPAGRCKGRGGKVKVEFLDSGGEPQCPLDPAYPKGKDIDVSCGALLTCIAKIPYPAPRCGAMVVECQRCGIRVGLTVAGRPDDPRSLRLPCKLPQ
jgi:hypothetical protein